MDNVSVYCLDPLNFGCFLHAKHIIDLQTSALLRCLQKMADSKPIY